MYAFFVRLIPPSVFLIPFSPKFFFLGGGPYSVIHFLYFASFLFLCWVRVHCSIYKGSYNESNVAYLNSPPALHSLITPYFFLLSPLALLCMDKVSLSYCTFPLKFMSLKLLSLPSKQLKRMNSTYCFFSSSENPSFAFKFSINVPTVEKGCQRLGRETV
jgi:hypothetical protein